MNELSSMGPIPGAAVSALASYLVLKMLKAADNKEVACPIESTHFIKIILQASTPDLIPFPLGDISLTFKKSIKKYTQGFPLA